MTEKEDNSEKTTYYRYHVPIAEKSQFFTTHYTSGKVPSVAIHQEEVRNKEPVRYLYKNNNWISIVHVNGQSEFPKNTIDPEKGIKKFKGLPVVHVLGRYTPEFDVDKE